MIYPFFLFSPYSIRGPTEEVASTLANGVKNRLNASLCIGEAGIAGPMSPSRRLPPYV